MKLIKRDVGQKPTQNIAPSTFFNEFFREPFANLPSFFDDTVSRQMTVDMPNADISETETHIMIEAEVPGFESKDITVEIGSDAVSIEGKTMQEKEEQGKKYYRKECMSGSFYREFALPAYADTEKAESAMKNGILTVKIPKKKELQKKQVKIKAE